MKDIKVEPRCPIRTTMELVGGKWRLLILFQLREENLRTSEIRRRVPGISEKMLIRELKALVVQQLIIRHDYAEQPPRVEYQITEKGLTTLPLIRAMKIFSDAYLAAAPTPAQKASPMK